MQKIGGGTYLRRIYGGQHSASDSARRNFSGGFSADKFWAAISAIGGG